MQQRFGLNHGYHYILAKGYVKSSKITWRIGYVINIKSTIFLISSSKLVPLVSRFIGNSVQLKSEIQKDVNTIIFCTSRI